MLRVAVGSTNPSKIRSVRQGLEAILNRNSSSVGAVPELDIQGLSAPSGVADQPMGDSETKLGARNRAKTSFDLFVEKFQMEPHLAIGLEGGLEEMDDGDWICMAWLAVFGKRSQLVLSWTSSPDCGGDYILAETVQPCWGMSKTATFSLPPKIVELVKGGLELGQADDQVFSRVNGKHGSGTVGILTNGLIDRSLYYEHALQLAMIPWIRPDVYP